MTTTTTSLTPDHPKLELLFYIVGDEFDDEDADGMQRLVETLGASRSWVIAPPEFVDDVVEATRDDEEDLPLVGGSLQVFSGYPPWGERIPRQLDRAQFDDVSATIDALREFSREHGLEIAVEYNGSSAGWIRDGVADELITETLLGAWERALNRSSQGDTP
jgi:hypothetical protein